MSDTQYPDNDDAPVAHPFTGTPYEPYDGDGYDVGPSCPNCHIELTWGDCPGCGGVGLVEDVDSDDYTDGDEVMCMNCGGDGGWYTCNICGHTLVMWEVKAEQELHQREE